MAVTTSKKINPYLRINTTLIDILDGVGSLQAAIPGLTVETLATFTGETADDLFNNSSEVNESTKIDTCGTAAVAVNQIDASVDVDIYASFALQQILNIPPTSSSATYIAFVEAYERVAHADNINPDESRILFILAQVGATLSKYWNDQKALGAGSDWNNYLSSQSFNSGWAQSGVRGALLYIQNGASIEAIIIGAVVNSIANMSSVAK